MVILITAKTVIFLFADGHHDCVSINIVFFVNIKCQKSVKRIVTRCTIVGMLHIRINWLMKSYYKSSNDALKVVQGMINFCWSTGNTAHYIAVNLKTPKSLAHVETNYIYLNDVYCKLLLFFFLSKKKC